MAFDGALGPGRFDLDVVRAATLRVPAQIIREHLASLPVEERRALADQLGTTDCQAMRSALHVGAELAFMVHDRERQERFAGMARLYELIAEETGLPPAAAGAASLDTHSRSLEEHLWFAAQNLPAEARAALRETFRLVIQAGADSYLLPPGPAGDPGTLGE